MAQTKKQNKIAVGGNVKISAYKGKRKIKQISVKNKATHNLFNFLLECLAGDLKQDNRPAFLKISAVTDIDKFDTQTPSISPVTKISSVSVDTAEKQGDESRATNEFFVLYSAFNTGGNTKPVYPKVFTLLDGTKEGKQLAEVKLTKQTTLEIDPKQMNYSLLIDWSIGFKNPDPVIEEPEVTQ